MATGDPTDITARLFRWVPRGWFPSDPETLVGALLTGFATALAAVFQIIQYAGQQVRIATASDGWLDLISGDFFGLSLPRRAAESDLSFRARIQRELVRPRGTRQAVARALIDLTGRTPSIFEPARPADTGAYNAATALAYNIQGCYGSLALPFQSFVVAFRPLNVPGLPLLAPYDLVGGFGAGGYGQGGRPAASVSAGTAAYGSLASLAGFVSDAAIYAAINDVRPAGTIIWARVSN
jgi:hypothetical protein